MNQRDIMGRASLNLEHEPTVKLFVKMKLNDIPGKYLFNKDSRCFLDWKTARPKYGKDTFNLNLSHDNMVAGSKHYPHYPKTKHKLSYTRMHLFRRIAIVGEITQTKI